MLWKITGRRAAEMHRIAVARLRDTQMATAEYVRVRVDRGLTEKFDAWEAEPPDAAAPKRQPEATSPDPSTADGLRPSLAPEECEDEAADAAEEERRPTDGTDPR